jgi:hypothetical protein
VTAYAICRVINGDLDVKHVPAAMDSSSKSYTVACGPGYKLLSGGVDVISTEEGAGANFDHPNERLVIDEIVPMGRASSHPTK